MKLSDTPEGDYICPVCGDTKIWFTLEDFEHNVAIARCTKNHVFAMDVCELVNFTKTSDRKWMDYFMEVWTWAEKSQKKLEEKKDE